MRLNLGSGPRAVAGWINVDRSPNVLLERLPLAKRALLRTGVLNEGHSQAWDAEIVRSDIRRLPYRSGSVDAVYSSHTLEHLYLDEAKQVVAEAARVLRSGGIIRLALPDARQWARELLRDEDDPEAGALFNRRLLAFPERRPGLVARLRDRAGGHVHRWQPTPAMVERMLLDVGFIEVRQCQFRQGDLPDLENVESREESFFLEAVLPAD